MAWLYGTEIALGVVVEQPRHERADDEVGALEGLVHRRWLVDAPGDRLEVVDGEGVRVQAAVPADHVERVVEVGVAGQSGAVADQHVHLALGDQQRFGGGAQVALAVRRVLEELPVVGQVATRRADVPLGLGDQGADRFGAGGHPAVRGRRRDHHVVAACRRRARRRPTRGGRCPTRCRPARRRWRCGTARWPRPRRRRTPARRRCPAAAGGRSPGHRRHRGRGCGSAGAAAGCSPSYRGSARRR